MTRRHQPKPAVRKPPKWLLVVGALFLSAFFILLFILHSLLPSADSQSHAQNRAKISGKSHHASLPQQMPVVSTQSTVRIAKSGAGKVVHPNDSNVLGVEDIWKSTDSNLPVWLKEYFQWHKETLTSLDKKAPLEQQQEWWNQQRLLILECHETSAHCGGLADRLSAMPFLLLLAATSRRLLLIYWGRPAPLEEFLMPPRGGLDWRMPTQMPIRQRLLSRGRFASTQEDLLRLSKSLDVKILHCRFQAHDHGSDYFNSHKQSSEGSFAEVTREAFRILFTPTSPVAARIMKVLQDSNLQPGQYAAAHLRALYAVETRDPELVMLWTENAVKCAFNLAVEQQSSTSAIFFAADNRAASLLAERFGASQGVRVTTRKTKVEPLHLDKTEDWKERSPRDFDDAFVDLYLLSLAHCVTFGMGGFGKFASFLSENSTCAMQHHSAMGITSCEIANTPHDEKRSDSTISLKATDIFLSPMPAQGTTDSGNNDIAADFPDTKRQLTAADDLWDSSAVLPEWMKSYFKWHASERKKVSADNWQDFKYVVMTCMTEMDHCGGTADRLRPIPFMIRVAAENKRLLFVYWQKPKSLESFLLPPVSGVDWRTPPWLASMLGPHGHGTVTNVIAAAQNMNQTIVQTKLQANDHGSEYYNQQAALHEGPLHPKFRDVFHDCWYSLFTPVPQIAVLIKEEMERMHLQPGNFALAHLRASYGIEKEGRSLDLVRNWTVNALNCLSALRPGGPFFFASDSAFARKVAVDYGEQKRTPILSRLNSPKPFHLDLVDDWEARPVSDFYEVFIELYIMSMAVCVTYNVGGFGKFAQLLSGRNFSCSVRHWTKGVDKKSANKDGCSWTDGVPAILNDELLQDPLFLPPMKGDV